MRWIKGRSTERKWKTGGRELDEEEIMPIMSNHIKYYTKVYQEYRRELFML